MGKLTIAPQKMWGTLKAIAELPECVAVPESAREVSEQDLVEGFVFGRTDTVSIRIDEPGDETSRSGEHRRDFPREGPEDS